MAFAYTLDYKTLMPPLEKRQNKSGKCYLVGGTFTNGASDTGGDIITGGSEVLYFQAVDENASPASIVVARSAGTVTITTTADHDGTWIAVILI